MSAIVQPLRDRRTDPERRVGWLDGAVTDLEENRSLDGLASAIDRAVAPLAPSPAATWLRGPWLGHALHPLLTDFPLGCWIGAGILDLVGGRTSRAASRRLVGMGVLAAVPTMAAGLAEWLVIDDPRTRRVASVHAVGNAIGGSAYLASWLQRRSGHHWRGVTLAMTGAAIAVATGYLGGHLSFGRRVGTGMRGSPATEGSDGPVGE